MDAEAVVLLAEDVEKISSYPTWVDVDCREAMDILQRYGGDRWEELHDELRWIGASSEWVRLYLAKARGMLA